MTRFAVCLSGLLLTAFSCHAFMLGRDRVVLRQSDGVISVPVLGGTTKGASLVKIQLLKDRKKGGKAENFLVSPPVMRLEEGGKNAVRIQLINTAGLPSDRESLFYLEALSQPATNPLSRDAVRSSGSVVMGTGLIVRFIYRPKSVNDQTAATWSSLQFRRLPGGVQVTNNTPNYISFKSVSMNGKALTFTGERQLAPFSETMLGAPSVSTNTVEWVAINDNGGAVKGQSALL